MKSDKAGRLFVISASSGVGKTTLVETLCTHTSFQLEQVITYTTRPARAGEMQDKHYHFISEHDFKQKIVDNFFLEWSTVYGNYYGSPRSIIENMQRGISKIIIVDRQGAVSLKELIKNSVLIWLYVKDLACLKERLIHRSSDVPADIEKRIALAHQEQEEEFNKPCFDYHICNDDLQHAIAELKRIIQIYSSVSS